MKVESRESLQRKYNLYRLAMFSFITVIAWIGFEIYRSYNKPKPTKVIQQQIEAVNPNLDLDIIGELQNRTHLSLSDLSQLEANLVFAPKPSSAPTPRPTAPPTASASATPTPSPSPTASPSGTPAS